MAVFYWVDQPGACDLRLLVAIFIDETFLFIEQFAFGLPEFEITRTCWRNVGL
jgi:hypothetical protein